MSNSSSNSSNNRRSLWWEWSPWPSRYLLQPFTRSASNRICSSHDCLSTSVLSTASPGPVPLINQFQINPFQNIATACKSRLTLCKRIRHIQNQTIIIWNEAGIWNRTWKNQNQNKKIDVALKKHPGRIRHSATKCARAGRKLILGASAISRRDLQPHAGNSPTRRGMLKW